MIALTGATGFVGRQVMRALIEQGLVVRAITRDLASLREYAHHPLVESVVVTDLFRASASQLREVVDGADTLIHAAWYTVPGSYLDSDENLICLSGTIALAREFVAAGGRRFVGIGTCAEYAPSETELEPDSPLAPTTLYAASKVAAYHSLRVYLSLQGVEFAWCRLFYLSGEGEDERRLIPTLRRKLALGMPVELSGGSQVRDYLDVAVAGTLIARVALGLKQGALNICSGRATTVREIAEGIADDYGRRDLLRFGARSENSFDPPCVVGKVEEI
ncbi:MAG TPA: NAD-dependent epimerase/dehydratase family protein [Azoarcus taiwanensis]|nr:NAD-dependent epimerase/dehydratase family protein [Azoarcus taiwanensis]